FWISFGLFTMAEKLKFSGLDKLAAATIDLADPATDSGAQEALPAAEKSAGSPPEHWTAAENDTWRGFERENYINGKWKLTGVTTPVNKETGEAYTGRTGYLDTAEVPPEMRLSKQPVFAEDASDTSLQAHDHEPDQVRIARHGRPPSKWLRSL